MSQPAKSSILLAVIGLVVALVGAGLLSYIVPGFAAVYQGFSEGVPIYISLITGFYGLIWAVPLLVITAAWFWPTPQQRGAVALVIGIAGFGFALLAVLILYLPLLTASVVT
jgi:hypothetical protein